MGKAKKSGPSYEFDVVRKPGAMKPVPGNPGGMVDQESQSMPAGLTSKVSDLGTSMKPVPMNPNTPAGSGKKG